MFKRSVSLLLLAAAVVKQLGAQVAPETFNGTLSSVKSSLHTDLLPAFYQLSGRQYVWLGHKDRLQALFEMLHQSANYALNESDYQAALVKRMEEGLRSASYGEDSLRNDMLLSDAALHFCSDVKTGNRRPVFGYMGFKYKPDVSNVPELLYRSLLAGTTDNLFARLEPSDAPYKNMLARLRWFNQVMAATDFAEVRIISNKVNTANLPLLRKLYYLGISGSADTTVTQAALVQQLKAAQRMLDVLQDGQLRKTCIAALNVLLHRRHQELTLAINYLRWLNQIRSTSFVAFVNLPSTSLYVYDGGSLKLDSKVIVGKPATPSPTLTSTITEVVLYPYWMVPNKIAVKELLPSIRRNIGFLDMGGFQVISKSTGRVVNPYSINWHSLGPGNFPYIIRQSTGCDNSLGLLKFNFDSPFSVYLHDTPSKSLFLFSKRYFSHGCIRVEKPVDLAHMVMARNPQVIDAVTQRGCLENQSAIPKKADRPLPLMILYSTVWYNGNGEILFYDDVYSRLPGLLAVQSPVIQYLLACAVAGL